MSQEISSMNICDPWWKNLAQCELERIYVQRELDTTQDVWIIECGNYYDNFVKWWTIALTEDDAYKHVSGMPQDTGKVDDLLFKNERGQEWIRISKKQNYRI